MGERLEMRMRERREVGNRGRGSYDGVIRVVREEVLKFRGVERIEKTMIY